MAKRAPRYMLVEPDERNGLRWNEVRLERAGTDITTEHPGTGQVRRWEVVKENDISKVIEVAPEEGGEHLHIVDFTALDDHLESNKVIFRNRRGLVNELRRYIEFSLS